MGDLRPGPGPAGDEGERFNPYSDESFNPYSMSGRSFKPY
jgi:hypothetical protein